MRLSFTSTDTICKLANTFYHTRSNTSFISRNLSKTTKSRVTHTKKGVIPTIFSDFKPISVHNRGLANICHVRYGDRKTKINSIQSRSVSIEPTY